MIVNVLGLLPPAFYLTQQTTCRPSGFANGKVSFFVLVRTERTELKLGLCSFKDRKPKP